MDRTKLSKSEVEKLLDKAIHEYKPSKKDSESFRQLANGVFQSEGTVSARLKTKAVIPVATLGQNLDKESLKFFVINLPL
jgi:hypothetical protein